MTTITLKLDERSKSGKTLKSLIDLFSSHVGVEVMKGAEKSPYNPEFLAMVKKSAESKNRTRINPKNVWESL
jgi:hypothetical protein